MIIESALVTASEKGLIMIKLGEKIKALRKEKNISQEVLAEYLGVTFQAVSKWENSISMPDVTLIPPIAAFFGVSTDELFDFNIYTVEKNVEIIVKEHSKYYDTDKVKCEQVLRDGLKKYPGNDVLLNCLLGVIPVPERSGEVIDLCKALIEGTRYDDVKYDAYRIMAKAYKACGEYALAQAAVENIPEIYFTKLQVAAELLDGDDIYEPAAKQKVISFEHLIDMLERLADYYFLKEECQKAITQLQIEKKVIEAFEDDFGTKFTKPIYRTFSDRLIKVSERIASQS